MGARVEVNVENGRPPNAAPSGSGLAGGRPRRKVRREWDLAAAEDFHRALLGASTFFEKALQELLEGEGVTPPQFYLLRTLGSSQSGALSPKVLQQSFVRRRNLTETVHRIVRDGLAERVPNPDDGRSVLIALTPRGRQVLDRAVTVYRVGLGLILETPDSKAAEAALGVLQEFTLRLRDQLYPELSADATS